MFIFFDLDDTVLCFKKEEDVALRKAFKEFGIEASEQNLSAYKTINKALWEKAGGIINDRNTIRICRFEQFFEKVKVDLTPEQGAEIYESKLAEGYAFMPLMPETLERLSQKHRLFLATNGITHIQKSRTQNADINKYFENKFVSEEIGYEKPKAEFFEYAMKKIPDFDIKKAIMVGDNLKADVKGANGVGMASCWYNPEGKPNQTDVTPTYEISSYDQLYKIIEEIDSRR